MLKALLLLLMDLALAVMATAQNLVPNPSFEDTTHCAMFELPYEEALHWYTANTATPDIWDCDILNPCGRAMDPSDPGIQLKGFKMAYEGQRFAGGVHWYGPGGNAGTREYLLAKLLSDLQGGQAYLVSAYCARPKGHRRAIDHIGVYFGTDSIFEDYPTALPYVPQVELRDPGNEYLVDTSWVQLVDTFIAVGGERWMVFGTFLNDYEVNGIDLPPLFPSDNAYYYLDAFAVVPVSAQGLPDSAPGVIQLQANAQEILWKGERRMDDLALFDAQGRLLWHPLVQPALQFVIKVPEELSRGTYVVRATSGGRQHVTRFIK